MITHKLIWRMEAWTKWDRHSLPLHTAAITYIDSIILASFPTVWPWLGEKNNQSRRKEDSAMMDDRQAESKAPAACRMP